MIGFVLMLTAVLAGVPSMFIVARTGRPRAAALVGVGALALHAAGNWLSS